MILSNTQQLSVLLWSLLFGAGLGFSYDLLRMFRVFVRSPAVAVLFQDLIYFLLSAVASFLFIFEVNDGTVRLFILGAFFAGGMAFRVTVGQLAVRLCIRMKNSFLRRPNKARQKTHNTHRTKKNPSLEAGENRCVSEQR